MAGRSDSTVRKSSFTGKAIGGGFAVLGLLGCGLIVRPVLLSVAADMADVVLGVFMLALALVGHAVTTWWGFWKRPHWTRWVFTQLPYLVVYVMLYVWYGVGWSIEDGGPPSLWIVPWVGLAGVTLSWVPVWWLDYGDRRNAKRAIVFLAMFVVLVSGNGFTAAVLVFRSTDGLGLQGPGTPEAAVAAFTANTCLFAHDWYHRGGKPVAADCPDWSSEAGEGLGRYVTSDQPRQALERWFGHYRAFEALPRLRYEHPVFEDRGDGSP